LKKVKKNVSITERPSLGQAALELRATPELSFLEEPASEASFKPISRLQNSSRLANVVLALLAPSQEAGA
jgi:hypothetical protein